MDERSSITHVGPSIHASRVEIQEFAEAAEARMARDDLAAAQAHARGEEYAQDRFWKLHVRAAKLGHRRWAAEFMTRFQASQAGARAAGIAVRAALEQLGRLAAEAKHRAPGLAKAARREQDLTRVVNAYPVIEADLAAGLKKKAAIVEERLGMSLPTFRDYVAEARKRGRL